MLIAGTDAYMLVYLSNLACFIVVAVLLYVLGDGVVLNLLIIYASITSVWIGLYVMQLSSVIGHFAITFNRMIFVLFQFFVLFLMMFLPFVHIFYRLLENSNGCPNSSFSSSVVEHYYNTFLILLNMISFNQFKEEVSRSNFYLLLFIHVLYVFLLSILLINFLIALLSHSVSDVMEHKDINILVQQLLVVGIADTFNRHFFNVIRNFVQRRCFHIEGERIFLIRTSVYFKKNIIE